MDKRVIIVLLTAILITLSYIGYKIYFYYSTDKVIQSSEISSVEYDSSYSSAITSLGNEVIVINKGNVKAYNINSKIIWTQKIGIVVPITDSKGNYIAVAEKNGAKVCLIERNKLNWDTQVDGEILKVKVNKNGYVGVVYSKEGYKALIKVYSPQGKEILTTFFANTNVTDIDINDNDSILSIAEVDTNGIKINSTIKTINISEDISNPKINILSKQEDSLISNLKFIGTQKILAIGTNGINVIDSNNLSVKKINIDSNENLHFVDCDYKKLMLVTKSKVIFSKFNIKLIDLYDYKEKVFLVDTDIKSARIQGNTLVVNVGEQIQYLNQSGGLYKRYIIKNTIKDSILYNNGNYAAIIFKDKLELINL